MLAERKGGFNPDTQPFDDAQLLGGVPQKIVAIKVWGDPVCVGGIEVTYLIHGGVKKAPTHVGSQGWSMPTQELHLDQDEFVIEVSGSHSQILNKLVIKTTKGKTIAVGGFGPQQFTLPIAPGFQAAAIVGGTNGHIHNIGVITAPAALPMGGGFGGGFGAPQPQQGFGGGFGAPQPQAGFGGGFGAPQPQAGFGGGFGGPQVVQAGPAGGGKVHPDSRAFDLLCESARTGNLHKVTLLHNGSLLYGIGLVWITPDGQKHKSGYVGRLKELKSPLVRKETLTLAPGEHIVEVSGRAGELIDGVTLRTNTGKSIHAGGHGGAPFPNLLPPGHYLAAFHGHCGGTVHRIGVHFK